MNTPCPLAAAPASIATIDVAVIEHVSPLYWDWRATFDADPAASPLQHPDALMAEVPRAALESTVLIRDAGLLAVLVPKTVRTTLVGGFPPGWSLRGLRLAGGRFLGQASSLDQQSRLLQHMVDYAARQRAEFVLIEDLDVAAPLYDLVQNRGLHGCDLFASHEFQPRRYIDLPASADEYWKSFSSRSLSKFRRNLKKFGRTRLERVTELEQIPDFLDAAESISRMSWQSRQFGQRVHSDGQQLRQLSALAMHGMLRSYLWWVEDTPVAFAICNQRAGTLRYEEIAYRPDFAQFSPGRTMLFQIVGDLLEYDPPQCLDFGGGDAEYKQQFANRESRSGSVWLVPPCWRSRGILTYLRACRRIQSTARRWIRQSRFGTRLRHWIRSRGGVAAPASAPSPEELDSSSAGHTLPVESRQ